MKTKFDVVLTAIDLMNTQRYIKPDSIDGLRDGETLRFTFHDVSIDLLRGQWIAVFSAVQNGAPSLVHQTIGRGMVRIHRWRAFCIDSSIDFVLYESLLT